MAWLQLASSQGQIFEGKACWASFIVLEALLCWRGVEHERNNHMDTVVSEEGAGQACQTNHSLLAHAQMAEQAEPLQALEIHCGEESHLQPTKDSMLEQGSALKKSSNSEGSLYCIGLLLGGSQPTGETHGSWRSSCLTGSSGKDVMLMQGKTEFSL